MNRFNIAVRIISTPGDQIREQRTMFNLASQLDSLKTEGITFELKILPAVMDRIMPRRGISKSHRQIVQQAKDTNLSEIMILEDDVRFLDKEGLSRFLNAATRIPKDCDLYFAGLYDGDIGTEFTGYAQVSGRISGLHCYIVYSKFYDTFLSADENLNLDYWLSEYNKPVMYCAYPMQALQYDGYSYNVKQEMTYSYGLNKKYKLQESK